MADLMIKTLIEKLHKGIVSFSYIKKDGTMRHAEGTLYGVGHTIKGGNTRHECSYVLKYYDVDCQAWRCFIMKNLVEVGEVRTETTNEHHDICLALVVKLKEKMQKEGATAFAYRKVDGSIRYAHGIISDEADVSGKYIEYFDTDKNETRKFRVDSFIGIGEPNEIADYVEHDTEYHRHTESHTTESGSFAHRPEPEQNSIEGLDIKSILSKKGIAMDDVENVMVIDLIPELSKEQLRDLIIRATKRLAEM